MSAARSCCRSMASPPVQIIDELVARPGEGRQVLDDYMTHYAPGAKARGMTLDRVMVSPPVWMNDQPNTIVAIWSVAGADGWWGMRLAATVTPGVAEFWSLIGPRLIDRKRRFAAAPDDVEALCNG